jgi:hypothetical protein
MKKDGAYKIKFADLAPAKVARSSAVKTSSSNLEVLTSQINILSEANPVI